MIEQEPNHPAPRPTKLRPLPSRIPPGAHVLSIADLKTIARFAGHGDDVAMAEELLPWILHHGMLDAPTGRIIPKEVLTELGEGDPIAGRKVLRRFIERLKAHNARPVIDLQDLQRRIPAHRLRRLLGGVDNITVLTINPDARMTKPTEIWNSERLEQAMLNEAASHGSNKHQLDLLRAEFQKANKDNKQIEPERSKLAALFRHEQNMSRGNHLEQRNGKGQFKVGHIGLGGRPRGSRDKLGQAFVEELFVKWQKHGADVLDRVIRDDPSQFLKTISHVLPKELSAEIDVRVGLFHQVENVNAAYKLALDYLHGKIETSDEPPLIEANRGGE
jgi:hypothetical protein